MRERGDGGIEISVCSFFVVGRINMQEYALNHNVSMGLLECT